MRNLEDVDRIKAFVDQGISDAVVVGAGFIGLELAENLVRAESVRPWSSCRIRSCHRSTVR